MTVSPISAAIVADNNGQIALLAPTEILARQHYKTIKEEDDDKVQVNGVFIPKKLFKKSSTRSCPVCNVYSFKSNDDLYMSKFKCCEKCYIQWVEGREERWKTGWRPNK